MTPLVLTKEDNNRWIQVYCNDELSVRLPENPSSAFRWSVGSFDDAVLRLRGDVFTLSAGVEIGGGGYRTFTYFALKPAEVRLHFELRRPWEREQSPVDSFDVLLRITTSAP